MTRQTGELIVSIADLKRLIKHLEAEKQHLWLMKNERIKWCVRMNGSKYNDDWKIDFSCWKKKKK